MSRRAKGWNDTGKRIQAREINATHHRASRTRCALRFVGTAVGELEVFQEQVHHHRLPPMEEICQFCEAVERKDATANCCCRSGKVVLASLHDSPQGYKQLYEDPLFVTKVWSYNSNFAFTSMAASLAEMSGFTEQLVKAQECVYTFRV